MNRRERRAAARRAPRSSDHPVFYVVESHADEDGECAICSALGIHVEDDGSITEL